MARPPIHHAPNRRVEMSAPGIPTSIHRHAERLVIERARELSGEIESFPVPDLVKKGFADLSEAVRVLDVLEGKRE